MARYARTLLPAAALLALAALVASAGRAAEAPKPGREDLVIKTLPGITVDLKAREVRLAGEVVLRKGPLELFVCSEGTREHESVVAVRARPSHLTFALALLDLKPGKPGFVTAGGSFSPPAGDVLRILCRYKGADGAACEVPAHTMLRLSGSESPLDRGIDWVYVGRPEAEALRAADREGTVICLSNFREAVIDVPFESSSDNTVLVYEANPKVVPPVGTPVELVIRAAGRRIKPKKVEAEIVLEKGKPLRLDGQAMDLEALGRTVNAMPASIRSTVLRVAPDETFGRVMAVRQVLNDALMRVTLALYTPQPDTPGQAAPPPLEVRVTADDQVTVGGKSLSLKAFREQLGDLLGSARGIHVRADAATSASTVAAVMAAARDAGVSVILSRATKQEAP